jgi:hypothetical protein
MPVEEVRRFRIASGAVAGLVLVQAALAGQFLTANSDALTAHRLVGEGLGLVALVVAACGYRLRTTFPELWWLALGLVFLVVAQTGLGFAGRESSWAAAFHVPAGVLTFGAACVGVMPKLRA